MFGVKNRLHSAVLAVAMSLASTTHAQQSFAPPQSFSPLQVRQLASTCMGCHGTNGYSISLSIPVIARKTDIELQMQRFKKGERPSTVMQQLAQGYTDAEIAAIAAYFAAFKPDF